MQGSYYPDAQLSHPKREKSSATPFRKTSNSHLSYAPTLSTNRILSCHLLPTQPATSDNSPTAQLAWLCNTHLTLAVVLQEVDRPLTDAVLTASPDNHLNYEFKERRR